jgi:hypothetical protein
MATDFPVSGARGGVYWRGRPELQIGGVAMQRADGETLVEIAAAAAFFTQARANASERTGQRQALGDHLHGAAMVARGDAIDEARNVQTGRTAGAHGATHSPA